jgi:hypothetical protein
VPALFVPVPIAFPPPNPTPVVDPTPLLVLPLLSAPVPAFIPLLVPVALGVFVPVPVVETVPVLVLVPVLGLTPVLVFRLVFVLVAGLLEVGLAALSGTLLPSGPPPVVSLLGVPVSVPLPLVAPRLPPVDEPTPPEDEL